MRILHGESLGSGVATAVASTLKSEQNSRVGAIVLEAPYTSIADVAAYHYPFVPARYLVRDRFDSISRIGQVDTPLLFVHGLNDRVVPVRFGKMLFDAAAEPKEAHWIEGARHNDLADHGITDIVMTFVMERLGQAIPPMP